MSLSKKKIGEIITRYKGGEGETPGQLAKAFGCAASTVRYHLKRAEVYNPTAPGDETDPAEATAQLAAMLENPALQALIDAAVQIRMAQMGAPAQAVPAGADAMAVFTASLAHMIEVQATQQAGYIKPLSAAEIDRRAAGFVELKAILKDYELRGTPPEWIIGESGFFECTNAIEYMPGQTIRTYLFPVEDFIPNNEQAHKVQAAMLQWIGGHTPGIGEQVEAAMRAANQTAPMVTGTLNSMETRPKSVELVATPNKAAPRKRVAGTVVPERHDVSLAERAAGPQGPVFVGERAA